MSKIDELIKVCIQNNRNVSLTYQRINDFSVEIYKPGSKRNDPPVFYSDGHISLKKAAKKGLKFMLNFYA